MAYWHFWEHPEDPIWLSAWPVHVILMAVWVLSCAAVVGPKVVNLYTLSTHLFFVVKWGIVYGMLGRHNKGSLFRHMPLSYVITHWKVLKLCPTDVIQFLKTHFYSNTSGLKNTECIKRVFRWICKCIPVPLILGFCQISNLINNACLQN